MLCGNVIAQKVFGMCRSNQLKLSGFPNFTETLKSLKDADAVARPDYEVCIALANGALVIKQCVIEMWEAKSDFAAEVKQLVEAHNREFNPENLVRGLESSNTPSQCDDVPSKKLCIEALLEQEEFETKFADRTSLRWGAGLYRSSVCSIDNSHQLTAYCRISLPCGAFTLAWCKDQSVLYITSEKGCTAEQNSELFGFGSGDFATGTEAADIMSDTTCQGRWLPFDLAGAGDKLVIFEIDKRGPCHLKDVGFANKVGVWVLAVSVEV